MIYNVTMTSLNRQTDYSVDVIAADRTQARAIAGSVIANYVADIYTGPEGIPWLGDTRTTRVSVTLEKVWPHADV